VAEATISDALPEEYKDKQKAEYARESHKNREGSGQTTEFDNPDTANRELLRDSNPAESGSVCPIGDVSGSEDFDKMDRGQDVTTEAERAKRLEQRLAEAEEERTLLRQEREDALKEKSTPELLKELQEKFADTPGLIDAKKLQKDMYLFSI
jgi:hypothetical protein